MRRYLLSTALLVIAGLLVSHSSAPPAAQAPHPPIDRISRLPIYFIQNQGQLDGRVAFYIQGRNTNVYFSPTAVTYSLRKPAPRPTAPFRNASLPPEAPTPASVVKLEFLNANPSPRIEAHARTEATISYFRGPQHQWRTALPTYGAVVYREVWPGIDVEFTGPEGNLKYTFLVRPGADPRKIHFAYRGASNLTLTPEGRLDIATPAGSFSDDKPVSWQESDSRRQPVRTAFTLEGEEVRFDVGAYDRSRDLFIDPVILTYSGFLGGSGNDFGRAIAVDAAGNVYVTGNTYSSNFLTAAGPDTTHNGDTDTFVAKFNSSGTALVYSGFLGGSSSDLGYGIAVDTAGNAYVTGETASANFPTSAGPDTTHNGGWDAFVAKVNSAGTALVYSGFLGGTFTDSGYGIAVDATGNAYVTGAAGFSFPTATGPNTTHNGTIDAFVAKVNSAGTALVYSGFLGGIPFDSGHKIAVDAAGNAYVTGYTDSTNFPTTAGSFDTTYNGNTDAFVAKVNSTGTALVYSSFLGGAVNDIGWGIAVDPAGNAYVTGSTSSDSFPTVVGPNTFHQSLGIADAFIAKVNPSGTALVYSGLLGGSLIDHGYGIALDAAGNAYVTGHTNSPNFPTAVGPDTTQNSDYDAFVAKVNGAGTALVYSGFLGGSGEDAGLGMAADATGKAYITGYTASSNFPSTVGPPPPLLNGFVSIVGAFPATAGPVLAFRNSANAIETNTFPTPTLRNAGGNFRLNPALAMWFGNVAVFASRDSAAGVWLNFLKPDDTYYGWVFAGGNSPGNPDVATTFQAAWIAIRDPWNSYWIRSWSAGAFTDWTWLQGILTTDPKIAGCPNGDVYITGKDNWNGVWTRRYSASFPGWQSWRFAGGIISGSPAITCGSDNAAYIAARDPSNNMWLARVAQESPATWHYGGGIFDGDPQIVSNGSLIHVFGLSSSVPWYRTWQIGLGWLGWSSPGGVLTHFSPAVYGGNLFVAGQSSNGNLWWWNGLSNSWTNFGNKNIAANSRLSAGAR
jgi:hypothetical protein